MKILRKRSVRSMYLLFFQEKGRAGRGYVFPCDAERRVCLNKLKLEAIRNLSMCQRETERFELGRLLPAGGDVSPAVGLCICGDRLVLWNPETNHCDCGRDYNGSGQQLAPTWQWGEETDEAFSDSGQYLGRGWSAGDE